MKTNDQSSINQRPEDLHNSELLCDSAQLYCWIYQQIRPYLKGKVLELEAGTGNITRLFVKDSFALRISDPDRRNCELLQSTFAEEAITKGIHLLDLSNPTFEKTYLKYLERFDTVLSVANSDSLINNRNKLTNAKRLLRDRGRMILFLPSSIALYEQSEVGLKDWRHYNRESIRGFLGKECELLQTQFLSVSDVQPFSNEDIPNFLPSNAVLETGFYILVIARLNSQLK
jgi:hypothetical protein